MPPDRIRAQDLPLDAQTNVGVGKDAHKIPGFAEQVKDLAQEMMNRIYDRAAQQQLLHEYEEYLEEQRARQQQNIAQTGSIPGSEGEHHYQMEQQTSPKHSPSSRHQPVMASSNYTTPEKNIKSVGSPIASTAAAERPYGDTPDITIHESGIFGYTEELPGSPHGPVGRLSNMAPPATPSRTTGRMGRKKYTELLPGEESIASRVRARRRH